MDTQGFQIIWQLATVYFVPAFVVLLGILVAIYAVKGQPITALTFLGFGAVLAAGEGASIYFTGKTISENHWYMDASDKDAGMTTALVLTALLLVIVVHLAKISIDRHRNKP